MWNLNPATPRGLKVPNIILHEVTNEELLKKLKAVHVMVRDQFTFIPKPDTRLDMSIDDVDVVELSADLESSDEVKEEEIPW